MKLEVLNSINNQCTVVQKAIAKNFGTPTNEEGLVCELRILYKLLDEYLNT